MTPVCAPVSAPEPSQVGLQVRLARMKARVYALTAVWLSAATGSTLPPAAGNRDGAPPLTAAAVTAAGLVAAWLVAIPPTAKPATTAAMPLAIKTERRFIDPP